MLTVKADSKEKALEYAKKIQGFEVLDDNPVDLRNGTFVVLGRITGKLIDPDGKEISV